MQEKINNLKNKNADLEKRLLELSETLFQVVSQRDEQEQIAIDNFKACAMLRSQLEKVSSCRNMITEDEDGVAEGFASWYERRFAFYTYKGSTHVSECEDAYRAGWLKGVSDD